MTERSSNTTAKQSDELCPWPRAFYDRGECCCEWPCVRGTPDKFVPGTFGCHEAMHMASVLAEMVDERLCEHPSIQLCKEWSEKAEAARSALFDLYQAIGREHCK